MTSAATSSRDLVRRSLQGSSTDRTPVIMHLGMYAPRLQQLTFHKVAHDPTLLANAVQSAQKLFGCDGVIPLIDTTLEAESCGCRVVWTEKDEPAVMSHPLADGTGGEGLGGEISSQPTGRLAVALEATQRLGTIMGRTVALLPAITGPVTIGQHLRGPGFLTELNQGEDAAADTLAIATRTTLDVARHYLDAEMEFLVVVDPLLAYVEPEHLSWIADALLPLWNVAGFFGAQVLLQTRTSGRPHLDGCLNFGADALVLEEGMPGDAVDLPTVREACIGAAVPPSLLGLEIAEIEFTAESWRRETCPPGSFLTFSTVPRSTPPENVQALLRAVSGHVL